MACRLINSPMTKQEVPSKTWEDIYNLTKSEEEADKLYEQLLTPEFINWFGDWINNPGGENVSKVVNEHGEPLVVYHGSPSLLDFDTFNKSNSGIFATSNKKVAESYQGKIYSDPFEESISEYNGHVKPLFFSIKNMQLIDDDTWNIIMGSIDLTDGNYVNIDGFKIEDSVFFVKEPNQIKSVFNKGEFNSNIDNIYLSNYDKVDKIIKGFNLTYKKVNSITEGFTTSNNRPTTTLIDNINKWLNNKPEFSNIRAVLNKTYNLIQFKDLNTGRIFVQSENTESSKASAETLSKIRDFMKQIGVDEKQVNSIVVNGTKLNANAVAKPLEALIEVVDGKESVSLPEEAIHISVEILEQTNATLFNQLLNNISKYNIYSNVLNTYKDIPEYQLKDGKPNIRKIKKEAIAKLLAETVIENIEGTTEKPELLAQSQTWWEKIITWFKQLFSKASNPFQTVAKSIIEGTFEGTAENLRNAETFYQVQEDKYNTLRQEPTIRKSTNEYERNGVEVKNNVSDIAGNFYKEIFKHKEITLSENKKALEQKKAEVNIKGHQDIYNILNRYIGDDGVLLNTPADKTDVSQLSPKTDKFYTALEDSISEKLKTYEAGTKFLVAQNLYDPKGDKAGTVDLIAILPNGKVDVLNWQFINVDPTYYKDIPWYHQKAFNMEMGEYKKILKSFYGITEFNQTRTIPINTVYNFRDKKFSIKTLRIGNVDATLEKSDILVPVATEDESTGNEELDKVISKLRSLYSKLQDTKVVEGRKDIKKEQLNKLFTTIRQIHVKRNFNPLFNYIGILDKEAENLLKKYNEEYKLADPIAPSQDELGKFFRSLIDIRDKFVPFSDMDISLDELFKDDPESLTKLAKASQRVRVIQSNLDKLLKESGDKFLGQRFDVLGLALAEKDYKGVSALFRRISQGGTAATTSLYKISEPVLNAISVQQRQALYEFQELTDKYKEWAESRGLQPKNMFDILFHKDKNGRFDNSLIRRTQKEFNIEFNEATDKKDTKWFKNNVDLDAFAKEAEIRKQVELKAAEEGVFDSDPEVDKKERDKKIKEINNRYDISTSKSGGWGNYLMRHYPLEKWYSKEYNEIRKYKPVLDLYEYILKINDTASRLGIIDPKVKNTFLPFVEKYGIKEKLIFGGDLKIGQRFANSITSRDDDFEYGYRDPLTGELRHDIYARYNTDYYSELKKDKEGNTYRDYSNISTDIFKTIQLFHEEVIKYRSLREITDMVEALANLEKIKDSILTGESGRVIKENGIIQTKESNENNYQFLMSNIMDRIYGIKVDQSQSNISLGTVGKTWDNVGKKVNKVVGKDILPTNLEGRKVPLAKLVDALNGWFQSKILTLNAGIIIPNIVGGKMQKWIDAGTYYSKSDLGKAEAKVASVAFKSANEQSLIGLIKTLYPFVDDRNRDRIIKVTASKLANTNFIHDILMKPYQYGSMLVELPHIIAMLENAIIIDGRIVNVNKYLSNKYNNRYSLGEAQRKEIEKQIDAEKKQLLETNGLVNKTKIIDNKLQIEGISLTDPSLLEYRSVVVNLARNFLGAIDPNDRSQANRNIVWKSALVFKNWMVPLLEKRVGGLRYAAGTDQWEQGRYQTLGMMWSWNLYKAAKRMNSLIKMNDEGVAFMKETLEKRKEDYKNKTGQELTITEAEFADLFKNNLKNSILDTMFFLLLATMVIGMSAWAAEDDDMDPETKGYWNFSKRMANKLMDEMAFYYNPLKFTEIFNGSIFPGLGVTKDIVNFASSMAKEAYGLSINDDEMTEAAHPLKYALKFSTIANNLAYYSAVASPEFAKSMGIHITSQSRSTQ